MEKKSDLNALVQKRKSADTISTLYVTDRNASKFAQSDPEWFEKGIFFKYIAIPYVNLYRFNIVNASNLIEDYDQENAVLLSIDIIKYAFDLLTNFGGGEISIEHKNSASSDIKHTLTKYDSSILKPDYEATVSVFENGWDDIKQLKLFEHFVTEILQTFDFERLNKAPADCRLLLVALVYFSRKRPDVKLEVYSILLSYVMLNVVFDKMDGYCDRSKSNTGSVAAKPFIDSFTDKDLVNAADCDVACSLMDKYFKLRNDELCDIFDRKALHPLVEFQRCLEELNFLNQLCGSQFERTVYRKTYNGTFVYKILRAMKNSECQDGFQFIQEKINPAPTVLAFLSGILGIYESILYDY
ncbi:uncharacterized protein LOC112046492 [Bicyclus anynana]|uniref:Uncharacterized protein LOC112046492 n=1 Tax=Bicyclus anynana TaxID=110368 RepID=A0A6J1N7C6_BICAN|nr:uncharacterized protein LOC112046492 [Bicyclus anynana]XP_023938895.2 uncharacterized protein LOC112046492 [Bicyclus anynana]XP_023938896.2 uncharacterized protein LOC112046492 [Bicyclus anynana]